MLFTEWPWGGRITTTTKNEGFGIAAVAIEAYIYWLAVVIVEDENGKERLLPVAFAFNIAGFR